MRNEIGTGPNIDVEIDVTDKSPFLVRLCHAKEEIKLFKTNMKRLCYLVVIKEGLSAYSNPVMINGRKVTKDKRAVTYFRHLNMRIAKNKLAYPLLKDTFSILGSSRCEVLSV